MASRAYLALCITAHGHHFGHIKGDKLGTVLQHKKCLYITRLCLPDKRNILHFGKHYKVLDLSPH